MAPHQRFFTADDVRALPDDGNRYEVVYGELLVTPAPVRPHQRIVGRLFRLIADYCDQEGMSEAWLSPADISWSSDTLVQPDVFVVPMQESTGSDWTSMRTLLLVAEVLSPSTARHDRFQKRALYQAKNVGVVWLVDLAKRQVEVWTPQDAVPTIMSSQITWQPQGALKPLVIDLATLFKGL